MGINIYVYVCVCLENVEHFERPKFWTAAWPRLLKVYICMYIIYIECIYIVCVLVHVYVFISCTYFNLYYLYSLAQNECV